MKAAKRSRVCTNFVVRVTLIAARCALLRDAELAEGRPHAAKHLAGGDPLRTRPPRPATIGSGRRSGRRGRSLMAFATRSSSVLQSSHLATPIMPSSAIATSISFACPQCEHSSGKRWREMVNILARAFSTHARSPFRSDRYGAPECGQRASCRTRSGWLCSPRAAEANTLPGHPSSDGDPAAGASTRAAGRQPERPEQRGGDHRNGLLQPARRARHARRRRPRRRADSGRRTRPRCRPRNAIFSSRARRPADESAPTPPRPSAPPTQCRGDVDAQHGDRGHLRRRRTVRPLRRGQLQADNNQFRHDLAVVRNYVPAGAPSAAAVAGCAASARAAVTNGQSTLAADLNAANQLLARGEWLCGAGSGGLQPSADGSAGARSGGRLRSSWRPCRACRRRRHRVLSRSRSCP